MDEIWVLIISRNTTSEQNPKSDMLCVHILWRQVFATVVMVSKCSFINISIFMTLPLIIPTELQQ